MTAPPAPPAEPGQLPGCASGCTASICTIVAIIIHVLGSVGINVGQNLQALAISRGGKKGKDRMWNGGMLLFAVSSVITFGALALASASILVPLESVQFVVNIIFHKVVRSRPITMTMYGGTVTIILGIVLVVTFGSNEEAQAQACYTEEKLIQYWKEPAWWVFLIISFGIALVSYVLWRYYGKAKAEGRELPYAEGVEAVSFTLSSALFGGGQMIVHTKLLAELLELSSSTGEVAFANWFFWVELVLVLGFGGYWLVRLTQCLEMFDPLFIIPLMQTAFIVFGAVAGGIFFKASLSSYPAFAPTPTPAFAPSPPPAFAPTPTSRPLPPLPSPWARPRPVGGPSA